MPCTRGGTLSLPVWLPLDCKGERRYYAPASVSTSTLALPIQALVLRWSSQRRGNNWLGRFADDRHVGSYPAYRRQRGDRIASAG